MGSSYDPKDWRGDGLRGRIGWWLRRIADRIDPDYAPRPMDWTFTFETGEGIRWREDGQGCNVAYPSTRAYEKAHTESDSGIADRDRRAETIAYLRTQGEGGRALLELLGYDEDER